MGAGHGHDHREHDALPGLAQGEAAGKILHIDAASGMAGDMTIAALLDLGVPLAVIEQAVMALPLSGYHLHRGTVRRSGIAATTFDVEVEAEQPERAHAEIDRMIAEAALPPGVGSVARSIFQRLARAEAEIHGIPVGEVHFHEVGAVDAIVDIVGAAAAFTWLGGDVNVSPLPMGRGFVEARHGVLPLPAPATVACLVGVPTYAADTEGELVTPTGAAIAATVGRTFEHWPSMIPEKTGWGAGTREIEGRPNVLRVVLGARTAASLAPSHVVVEANLDDCTGEVVAHAIAQLVSLGALDVWATPNVMKKGRPGLTISALGTRDQADALSDALLRETSSIGVRRYGVSRVERPREIVTVATPFGPIPVKVSRGPFGPALLKPEFDACAAAARAANVNVSEVIAAAFLAAQGR